MRSFSFKNRTNLAEKFFFHCDTYYKQFVSPFINYFLGLAKFSITYYISTYYRYNYSLTINETVIFAIKNADTSHSFACAKSALSFSKIK